MMEYAQNIEAALTLSVGKFSVSSNDIPWKTAYGAYMWLSHSPEERGARERINWVDFWSNIIVQCQNVPEDKHQDLMVFLEGSKAHLHGLFMANLHALSRTASTLVTGAANFNTRRNDKANASAGKRNQELLDGCKKFQTKLENLFTNPKPTALNAPEQLAQLEALLTRMKTVNAITRKAKDAAHRTALLLEAGIVEADLKNDRLFRVHEDNGYSAHALANVNARIKTLKQKVAFASTLEERAKQPDKVIEKYGVTITQSWADDRLRLQFPERVSNAMFQVLRKSGWKWSPTRGVFQRQNTNNAIASMQWVLEAWKKERGL